VENRTRKKGTGLPKEPEDRENRLLKNGSRLKGKLIENLSPEKGTSMGKYARVDVVKKAVTPINTKIEQCSLGEKNAKE